MAKLAEDAGAPRRTVQGENVKIMLAHTADAPFSDPEWMFELKLDGYRMIASRRGPVCRLHTRNGNDATTWFPEIVRTLRAIPVDDFVVDGEIVAAAQEERFSRKKHDFRFPQAAIDYCLEAAGINQEDLDYVGFYDKPVTKFERLLETYLAYVPAGMSHCPLIVRKVERPIFHFTVGLGADYVRGE